MYDNYQTYTMTVYGPGGTATCQTYSVPQISPPLYTQPPIYHAPPVYHQPVYHQPIQVQIPQRLAAAQIALTQIPYTGFGFGEFGTAMYWLSIVMIAALGAGALAYFRSDLFSVAGVRSLFMKETRSARLREFLGEETLSFTPTRHLGIR